MRALVVAVLVLVGGCQAATAPLPDLQLMLSAPHSALMVSGLEHDQPVALMDLADTAVAFYLASDHNADDAGVHASERLSVTLPLGGTDRYPLDGVIAGLFYRDDALGMDFTKFRGFAWWQEEPDGWQIEINAISVAAPTVSVRATFSGRFVDHAMTGAPLNP